MRAIHIPTHPDIQMEERFIDRILDEPWYTALAKELGVETIERVRVGWASQRRGFENAIMLVDEEGAMPYKQRERNPRASYLYGNQVHGGSIYGPALLIGEGWTDNSDDDTGPGIDFKDLPSHFTVENLDRLLADDDGEALFPN